MWVLAGTSFAATINVPGDYATIQAAVDAAKDGDVIVIGKGVFVVVILKNVRKKGPIGDQDQHRYIQTR